MELVNRDKIERQMRDRARLLAAAHRRELARLLGSPPEFSDVPDSFWQQIGDQMEALLVDVCVTVFTRSAEQHGASAVDAERAAAPFAMRNGFQRAARFVANALDRLRGIVRKWRDRLGKGGRITRREIDEELKKLFGDDRADGLIETEFTRSSVQGAEWAMRRLGLTSPDDEWKTNPSLSKTGPCFICAPLDGAPRAEWAARFPLGPPVHDRCVCEIVYKNKPPKELWGVHPSGR